MVKLSLWGKQKWNLRNRGTLLGTPKAFSGDMQSEQCENPSYWSYCLQCAAQQDGTSVLDSYKLPGSCLSVLKASIPLIIWILWSWVPEMLMFASRNKIIHILQRHRLQLSCHGVPTYTHWHPSNMCFTWGLFLFLYDAHNKNSQLFLSIQWGLWKARLNKLAP